jgi:hypothetical protein
MKNDCYNAVTFRCTATLIIASLSLIGCGGSQLNYAPLSGVITVDGRPLAKAQIVLQCDDITVSEVARPTCRAVSDESGKFTIKTLTPEKRLIDGAVVGKHRVAIRTEIIESGPQGQPVVTRKEMLPAAVTNGDQITVVVPSSGKTDWQLAL